jgi:hypothetical protein
LPISKPASVIGSMRNGSVAKNERRKPKKITRGR